MARSIRRLAVVAAVMGLVATAARAESLEEVQKKIAEAAKKVKSISAKQKMETKVEQPEYSMTMTSEGTYEQARAGDKFMMRSDVDSSTSSKMAGTENKTKTHTLAVSDGETMWTLNDQDGTKSCTKMKALPETQAWDSLKDQFNGKVLPDEKIDGADCYVLEYTAKGEIPAGMPGKYVYWFRKDCGLLVKYVMMSTDGKPTATMTFTDVKVDGKIAADRFKFEPPAGVQVTEING